MNNGLGIKIESRDIKEVELTDVHELYRENKREQGRESNQRQHLILSFLLLFADFKVSLLYFRFCLHLLQFVRDNTAVLPFQGFTVHGFNSPCTTIVQKH